MSVQFNEMFERRRPSDKEQSSRCRFWVVLYLLFHAILTAGNGFFVLFLKLS